MCVAVFGCSVDAQTQLMKGTLAMERAVSTTLIWVSSSRPNGGSGTGSARGSRLSGGLVYKAAEELKSEVKKIGGYFQLLIQVSDTHEHRYAHARTHALARMHTHAYPHRGTVRNDCAHRHTRYSNGDQNTCTYTPTHTHTRW